MKNTKENNNIDNNTHESSELNHLKRDHYNYDNYLKEFYEAQENRDLCRIREILSFMKQHLALPIDLWKSWIKSESTLSPEPNSVNELKHILSLYDQALEEYLDIDLCLEYINFIEEIEPRLLIGVFEINENQNEWIEGWKSIQWDRVISATEKHYMYSHKVWNEIFQLKKKAAQDAQDSNLKDILIQELHALLLDRLAVPHQELAETYSMYSMYVTEYMEESYEQIMIQVNSIKENTQKRSIIRENHERKLQKVSSDNFDPIDSFNCWVNYLKAVTFENSAGLEINVNNASEISTIAERMLVIHFNNPKAWLYYLNLMKKLNAVSDRIQSIMNRATRNCPWSGELWGCMLYTFPNCDQIFETVIQNKALNYSPNEMTLFLLARINIEKCLFIQKEASEDSLRNTCANCISALYKEKAILVWEKSPKNYKKLTYFWLQYTQFVKNYVSIDKARHIFISAISSILKTVKNSNNLQEEQLYFNCEEIFNSLLSMEYENGDLDNILNSNSEIELCKNKIANHLYHLRQEEQTGVIAYYEDQKIYTPEDSNTKNAVKRERDDKDSQKISDAPMSIKKIKQGDKTINMENNITSELLENYTVCVSPLISKATVPQLEKHFSTCGPIRKCQIVSGFSSTGTYCPIKICHISFQSANGVINALLQNNTTNIDFGDPKFLFNIKIELVNTVNSFNKAKQILSTLVIDHIPKNINQKELKDALEKITSFCDFKYIEGKIENSVYLTVFSKFEQNMGLKKLCESYLSELNLQLNVNIFDRSLDKHKANFNYSQETTIYVTNIDYKTTLETLVKFFEEYLGSDFFIIDYMTDKNNKFLGQAMVYFNNKETVDLALKLHDFELDSRKLCIKSALTLENFTLPLCETTTGHDDKETDLKIQQPKFEKNKSLSTVRITGFSQNTSILMLKDISSQIVKVDRIHKNKVGNKIFIDTYNYDDANSLVNKLNGMFIGNSKIRASHVIENFSNDTGLNHTNTANKYKFHENKPADKATLFTPRQKMNILPRNAILKNKDKSQPIIDKIEKTDKNCVDQIMEENTEASDLKPKTNDDFRNMFLSK
ncbi:hypothetical protein BB561_002288 [Smittium simulii]|uniref:RRM domain-containing protein n=1 Tax=Smittium simulii TaxID=133385 RepID=A0A2T9YQZ2_9FUNG|nr:hypothetical protein BB561_002288 [Smittium simulii]